MKQGEKLFFMARYSGACHAILRITTGLTLFPHGTSKLLGWPPFIGHSGKMLPPQPVTSLLGFSGLLDLVGSVLLVIGFFTKPTAFILCGYMAVAYWAFHGHNGFLPLSNGGELSYLFCFIFLWLSAAGAGPWSIDHARIIGHNDGP